MYNQRNATIVELVKTLKRSLDFWNRCTFALYGSLAYPWL